MAQSGLSQKEVADRAGVSQKTISNMLNSDQPGIGASTIDKVEAVANAFGLHGWHLIMPGLPDDMVSCKSLSKLVEDFLSSPPSSRELISHTAGREKALSKSSR